MSKDKVRNWINSTYPTTIKGREGRYICMYGKINLQQNEKLGKRILELRELQLRTTRWKDREQMNR